MEPISHELETQIANSIARTRIVARSLVAIYEGTHSEDVKHLIFDAFGNLTPEERVVGYIDNTWRNYHPDYIQNMYTSIGHNGRRDYSLEEEAIFNEIIHPVSEALRRETGTALCADDIAEQIPWPWPVPQEFRDLRWDRTDLAPYRSSLLANTVIRKKAYPYIRGTLEGKEWFTPDHLLANAHYAQYPPHESVLMKIVRDGFDYYASWYKVPKADRLEGGPFSFLEGYAAPNMWPQSQKLLAIVARRTIQGIKDSIGAPRGEKQNSFYAFLHESGDESRLKLFIEQFLERTEAQLRSHLRVVVNSGPGSKPE